LDTVQDYFERALRRAADPPSGIPGEPCFDRDGATAQFWISADASGRIAAARYRCTTCMTLVALCEHLAELVEGKTVGAARSRTAERLLSLHREVPPVRQSRASLAISAMQSAVAKQFEGARF
jgi:NifU-like protein involved in Fe-S cluster formation